MKRLLVALVTSGMLLIFFSQLSISQTNQIQNVCFGGNFFAALRATARYVNAQTPNYDNVVSLNEYRTSEGYNVLITAGRDSVTQFVAAEGFNTATDKQEARCNALQNLRANLKVSTLPIKLDQGDIQFGNSVFKIMETVTVAPSVPNNFQFTLFVGNEYGRTTIFVSFRPLKAKYEDISVLQSNEFSFASPPSSDAFFYMTPSSAITFNDAAAKVCAALKWRFEADGTC